MWLQPWLIDGGNRRILYHHRRLSIHTKGRSRSGARLLAAILRRRSIGLRSRAILPQRRAERQRHQYQGQNGCAVAHFIPYGTTTVSPGCN